MSSSAQAAHELRWITPTRADKQRLQAFCCCEHEERRPPYHSWQHSKSWELEVQKMVRHDLFVPSKPPHFLLMAEDDQGIAALSSFEQQGDFAYLDVMAVALRLRGRRFGRELMRATISRMIERAQEQGVKEVGIECRIDPRNEPSTRLVTWAGFEKQAEPDLDYAADGIARIDGEVVLDPWTATLYVP